MLIFAFPWETSVQSGAGELDPRRQSREYDLQGAPAPLLAGEGGFQQGQGFTQTHGAGERAQHQAVDTPPPFFHLPAPRPPLPAASPRFVSSRLCCLTPPFPFFIFVVIV